MSGPMPSEAAALIASVLFLLVPFLWRWAR